MALSFGAITKVAVASSAASGTLPGSSGKFLLTCNTDCYVNFDGVTASATVYKLFMPKGLAIVVMPKTGSALSVIRASADGVLSIQEVE